MKVGDESMLAFIRDRTAAPYFSNLVWFIGNHIVELDNCVRADAELVFHKHLYLPYFWILGVRKDSYEICIHCREF